MKSGHQRNQQHVRIRTTGNCRLLAVSTMHFLTIPVLAIMIMICHHSHNPMSGVILPFCHAQEEQESSSSKNDIDNINDMDVDNGNDPDNEIDNDPDNDNNNDPNNGNDNDPDYDPDYDTMTSCGARIETSSLQDEIDDSFYHPLHSDPSCAEAQGTTTDECWNPPQSTLETEEVTIDITALYGGNDPSEKNYAEKQKGKRTVTIDKHWGGDETILKMRDKLRDMGSGKGSSDNPHENKRPPIFLMPGLASTRLVSWRYKACSNPLLSDVKVQDYVWMNINMLFKMATLDDSCFLECMTLGMNQTDMNDETGCKLRPDEGLDAISSLAPDSIGSNVLVGGKNTVYAWLTQWLADNLGYDVTNIIGLPYDWRLSPDVMEARDGFLTLTRRRIEAAVASSGEPGIMVAHSVSGIQM